MSFFLAVDLDEPTRDAVAALIARQREHVAANWLPPHKLHLTVLFLGEQLPDLEGAMLALGRDTAPFSLSLRGAGTFETARAPSVLWLGVEGDLAALRSLRAAVLERAAPLAPPAERDRPYVPHLTLARGKRPGHFEAVLPAAQAFEAPAFEVRHLVLYESRQGEFTARWRAPFSATGA